MLWVLGLSFALLAADQPRLRGGGGDLGATRRRIPGRFSDPYIVHLNIALSMVVSLYFGGKSHVSNLQHVSFKSVFGFLEMNRAMGIRDTKSASAGVGGRMGWSRGREKREREREG